MTFCKQTATFFVNQELTFCKQTADLFVNKQLTLYKQTYDFRKQTADFCKQTAEHMLYVHIKIYHISHLQMLSLWNMFTYHFQF